MEAEIESEDVEITSVIEDDDEMDPWPSEQGTSTRKHKSSDKYKDISSSSEEDEFEESSSSSEDDDDPITSIPEPEEEDVPLAKRLDLKQDKYQKKTNETDSDVDLDSIMEGPEDPSINREIRDDILRGMMDRIPIGRNYSPQYYYARKLIYEPKWIHRVRNYGIYKTTLLMYKKYNELPTYEKKEFVQQSQEFYDRTRGKFGVPRRRKKDMDKPATPRINPKKPYFFEEEPVPPPQKAKEFYESEMRNKIRFSKFTRWHSIDTNLQLHYVKKQYLKTQKYIYDYEAFIQRMSPPDLLCYVFHLYENWEKMKLQPFLEAKNFTFPLPKVSVSDDLRPRLPVFVENPRTLPMRTTPPDPNPNQPLANDQFITWLERKSAPKKKSRKKKAKNPSDDPNLNRPNKPSTKSQLVSQKKKVVKKTICPPVPSFPLLKNESAEQEKSRKRKLTTLTDKKKNAKKKKLTPKAKGKGPATSKEKKPRKKRIKNQTQTNPDAAPPDPDQPISHPDPPISEPNPLPSTNDNSSGSS